MSLPSPIIAVLAYFEPLFTTPTWKKVVTLVVGTLLARGRRTVTAALRQMDQQMNGQFSLFHHVLNRARWSPLEVSRRLLQVLVGTFVYAGGTVEIVIDETLERRWGRKISKRGHWRDSLRSSKERAVSSSGLRWITMALVVTLPWTKLRWALPFLSVLATTPKVSEVLKQRHKTTARIAQQLVSTVRRWLPQVAIKVIGDGAYSVIELGLTCLKQGVSLIAPLRLDARLFAPPPSPKPHQKGRPRVVGQRLPQLSTVLHDPNTPWETLTVKWYGGTERKLDVTTGTALWYSTGTDPLPIRWILTRDPEGKREPKAYFSTDQAQSATEIVEDFVKRWPIEVTYEESRAHLGVETQRQWSDLAIERSTPCLFGLYSLVVLLGYALHPDGVIPVQQAAWYPKAQATFSDVLATVRQHVWAEVTFQTSPAHPDVCLVSRSDLNRLVQAVCY
ncbi:MAG TPA: transposase [Ktedonobacteraceae bacterium]|nr:transposase [Ktedonobacteraceae bacterium]